MENPVKGTESPGSAWKGPECNFSYKIYLYNKLALLSILLLALFSDVFLNHFRFIIF